MTMTEIKFNTDQNKSLFKKMSRSFLEHKKHKNKIDSNISKKHFTAVLCIHSE